jgi:vacuolar iron transporter family protein
MPTTPHIERHFTASDTVRDVVIGMSDGLTVPFALAAGLSGAAQAATVVVTAGLAEIAAGSIAMGLGGYLAARSDAEHYQSEQRRERDEVVTKAEAETAEVTDILTDFGLPAEQATTVVDALKQSPDRWVEFMMRFELGLEKPDPKRARTSALTIAGAYIAGGLIPLSPYFVAPSTSTALAWSAAVTLVALFVFGLVKGHFTGAGALKSGLQTLVIGAVAASAAFVIARLIAP